MNRVEMALLRIHIAVLESWSTRLRTIDNCRCEPSSRLCARLSHSVDIRVYQTQRFLHVWYDLNEDVLLGEGEGSFESSLSTELGDSFLRAYKAC